MFLFSLVVFDDNEGGSLFDIVNPSGTQWWYFWYLLFENFENLERASVFNVEC